MQLPKRFPIYLFGAVQNFFQNENDVYALFSSLPRLIVSRHSCKRDKALLYHKNVYTSFTIDVKHCACVQQYKYTVT